MVNRERFHIFDSYPPVEDSAVTIRDVLGTVFKRIDANSQSWMRELEREWPEFMGRKAANHARPGRFERHVLVIYVDSAVWVNELIRYKQVDILARLQKRFGQDLIKSIRFKADPDV